MLIASWLFAIISALSMILNSLMVVWNVSFTMMKKGARLHHFICTVYCGFTFFISGMFSYLWSDFLIHVIDSDAGVKSYFWELLSTCAFICLTSVLLMLTYTSIRRTTLTSVMAD